MATSVMQVRVDNELRTQATAVYEELGIDLPTAIRMFLKRSVAVNGVPFSMTLPRQDYNAERAIRAMQSLSEAAQRSFRRTPEFRGSYILSVSVYRSLAYR